ncbi:type II toxin-antitoxin system death-on-curing family toxin [Roseovarius sp. MMSF_3281]|uniref:type II toxin-antitoxin system death-on-curing family toxin n=1 Tax=Roseovarius sp. MMSF_3281 TaxID=3046694 RepID=UPI00353272D2
MSNIDSLLGALGRPYHGYHPPISRKAAALLHGVATSHGFVDANKRTAWLITELLIERSGYQLTVFEDDAIDDLVVNVVIGAITEIDAANWFKQRLVKCD